MDGSIINLRRACMMLAVSVASTLAVMPAAQANEVSAGQTIATHGTAQGVAACIGCHGAKGEGNAAAGFPRLAGLSAAYLSTQLTAFAEGTRPNPIMQPMAKLLTASERSAVASYFAGLPAPAGVKASDSGSVTPANVGAWIATRGRWDQALPACVQCHGPGGIGVAPTFPPLAGQPAAYIASQLHNWKDGKRPPGPMALMPVVASKLSDADITAVADYYAGVGVGVTGAGKSANGSKP
ncbi:cytochrome c553 [Paraburkholderia bryophila]|uniref:Cytochrome c553 n=3 Tax=Burkholderiaceae TaxID=119060 RepID=A0A7Z0B594_9BURK|nr:cytochrome c553 [Paraburkholderia bryophila]